MRGLRGLLLVLVVVVALATAADYGARRVAEDRVAAEVRSSQSLPETPDVRITGFPFLTQLAAGRFSSVEITSPSVPVGAVDVESVRATVTDVEIDPRALVAGTVTDLHAGSLDVQATVSYPTLNRLLANQLGSSFSEVRLAPAGADQLVLSGAVAGVPFEVPVQLTLSSGQIVVSAPDAVLGGLAAPTRTLLGGLDLRFEVPALPYGVTVTRARPTPAGVLLEAAGDDLTLG